MFTRPLAYLDTEQPFNISSNTLKNWSGRRSHDYAELQNLNLIIHNLIASNFEGLAFQYAISRARDVLFAIRSNWTSVRAAHIAEDLQALNFNVAPVSFSSSKSLILIGAKFDALFPANFRETIFNRRSSRVCFFGLEERKEEKYSRIRQGTQ